MTASSPYRSRTALYMLVGAAVILVVGVAVTAAAGTSGPLQTRQVGDTFAGIRQIEVDVDSGSVDVSVAEGDTTTVAGELRWNTRTAPDFTMSRTGTTLKVISRSCGSVLFRSCDAQINLTVPASVELTLRADSGNVTATGVTGAVKVDIDSGNARLRDISGPINAVLDSGDITGTGLAAARTKVEVDSGNVELDYTTAPTEVVIDGDSSDLTVRVPRQSPAYQVSANTDSGHVQVDVTTATASANRIQITNDSGGVLVEYAS